MVLPVEASERIRRAHHVERKSIHQVACETGHCRDGIRRAIEKGPPQTTGSSYPQSRSSPIFGPFQSRIDALLTQREQFPRKQRYTSHRIFENIQAEGYEGCESSVRQYLAEWRHTHQQPDLFLPLEFEPGQDAQGDWGEAIAVALFMQQSCSAAPDYTSIMTKGETLWLTPWESGILMRTATREY